MDIPLIPGTLSQDCYPSLPSTLYAEMFARGHGVIPDIIGILIQDAAPTNLTQGWIPTAGGVPIYPGYVFVWHAVVGHWVSRHWKLAADPRPEIYTGSLSDLQTFDGGDTGAPGIASGPMWEQWTAINGRVPVGAGDIPGSGSPAKTIASGATQDSDGLSGEYKHVLTGAEGGVTNHVHPMGFGDVGSGSLGLAYTTPAVTTPSYQTFFNSSAGPSGTMTTLANLITLQANDGNGVTSDGHLTMQPYLGVYYIKRTARQFYIAG